MTTSALEEMAVNPGLQGVVAAQTRLSFVGGETGELIIAGYPLQEFAGSASFEEALYLLWYDRSPNSVELKLFQSEIEKRRELSSLAQIVIREGAHQKIEIMELLRMIAGTIAAGDDSETALRLVAQLPVIVAASWRVVQGQEPVTPRAELGTAANFLWMLEGELPRPERVRALDTYFNTVIDHGLNASTFTARVIISTGSDLVSAIVGAIGALKGPLHGGAPGPALDMVFEIGTPERIEPVLRAKLERGERLMGFGHRIYKVRDPRAEVLSRAAQQFFQGSAEHSIYDLAKQVEAQAVRLLEQHKPGRQLQTNVEFYTALLLHGLGLPVELFTPTFTLGRLGGWCAHCAEQRAVGRIIRPQSLYIGERNRQWVSLEARN